MKVSNKRTVAQFLALAPEFMSIQKVTKTNDMTEQQAKKARTLYCEKGLLALSLTYKGKILSKDVIDLVHFLSQ